MKFLKENKILVICGAVALLFLLFAFAPIPYFLPTLRDELIGKMQTRYGNITQVKHDAEVSLSLPGVATQKGPPSQGWVDAKNDTIKKINEDQLVVEKDAQTLNQRGRVNGKVPILPVPNSADLMRSTGMPIPGFLPKKPDNVDANEFKSKYETQLKSWTKLLATGTPLAPLEEIDYDLATPPSAAKIKVKWDDAERERVAKLPPGTAIPGGSLGGTNNPEQQKAERAFYKAEVMNKAASLHMFIEPTALQRRSWLSQNNPPDEQEIFEALVDSWIQSDVVKSIFVVNSGPSMNVGKAPIKRLTRIVVGNNARKSYLNAGTPGVTGNTAFDPGPLFFTSTNGNVVGVPGQAVTGTLVNNPGGAAPKAAVNLPVTPNPSDYTLGMTGHAAGATYDVTYMSVVMDMDPAAVYKFIDQFYRQNMGYTIVNYQQHTVDPIERASNGYLYGEGQVVEVEILFECIFFRGWTADLMPDAEKVLLGATAG